MNVTNHIAYSHAAPPSPAPKGGAPAVDIASLPFTECVEETPVFEVPEAMRREGAAALSAGDYVQSLGLEDLFPGTGLADAFDADASFRTALRAAARDDMFLPNPKLSDAANEAIKGLGASLMTSWRASHTDWAALTALFASRGLQLDGPTFMAGLAGLVSGSAVSGSLIDIVGITGRPVVHSWHQDNGLAGQVTAMLGFPPANGYVGPGVFRYIPHLGTSPQQTLCCACMPPVAESITCA